MSLQSAFVVPRISKHLPQQRHTFSHALSPQTRLGLTHVHNAVLRRLPHTPFQRRILSSIADPPPPPSWSRRILRTLLKYTLLTGTSLLLGSYLAVTYLPNRSAILSLLRPGPTPTDAESLHLYTPPDPASAAIDTHILTHPLVASLRQNPAYTESRPHMKIPGPLRPTNLSGGTLAGPGRIVVPPLVFQEEGGKALVSVFYLGEQVCGHPGIVHGGMLATLLDEGLARCCFPALPGKVGVTASLKVKYLRPAKAGAYYVLKARTVKVEGRKAWVQGGIEELREGADEGEGERVVEAEALFIEPRNIKAMKRLYSGEP